jgi:hypothetical protein
MKTSKRTMSKTGTLYYSVLDWVTNHRTKLSYTETYLKIIVRWLLMISVPLVQATWLTPTYPMKRIYFRHIGIRGLGDKVTLTPVYTVCIIMTKLEYETRNPNGSAAVVRYRSNIGSNLWFWNHVWLEFKPNFFEQKKTLSGMSSLTLP